MLHHPQYFEINRDSPQAKGLVGWWPSTSRTKTLHDLSGYKNHGGLNANVVWRTNPFLGGHSLEFNATDTEVEVPASPSLNIQNDITLTAWIKIPDTDIPTGDENIVAEAANGNLWDYQLFLVPLSGNAGFAFYSDNTTPTSILSSINYSAGVFHLITATRIGGTVTLYTDGLFDNSGSFTGAFGATSRTIRIGWSQDSGDTERFDGDLTDVRIYNRGLSAAEVWALVNPSTRWDLYKPIFTRAIRKSTVSVPVQLTRPKIVQPSYKENYARNSGESAFPNLWKGLIGAWVPALGPTGSTLFDWSGFKNNGTLTLMEPINDWVIGGNPLLPGYVLDFDGSNDTVDMGDLTIWDGLTTASWVLWIRKFTTAFDDVFLGKWDDGVSSTFLMEFDDGVSFDAEVFIAEIETSGGAARAEIPTATFEDNQWYHVAVVFDGGGAANADRLKFYVDGLQLTLNFPATAIPTSLINSTAPFQIGGNTDLGRHLPGQIAEVRAYNRALRSDEIVQDYQVPLAPFRLRQRKTISRQKPLVSFVTHRRAPQRKRPAYFEINRDSSQAKGLVGWWPLTGKSGITAFDLSGHGNHCVFSNEPVWKPNEFLGGQALDFDGVNDAVETGIGGVPGLSPNNGTITAWFNQDDTSVEHEGILAKDSSSGNIGDFFLGIEQSDGANPSTVRFEVQDSDTVTQVINSDSAVTTGRWTHVAVTFGVGGMTMYVDGVLQADTNANTDGIVNDQHSLVIGSRRTSGVEPFDGLIGDCRIYKRQLPAGEIWHLFKPETRWDLYKSLVGIRIANVAEIEPILGTTPLVGAVVVTGIALHMDLGITVPAIRR